MKHKPKLTLDFDPDIPRLDPNMFTGSDISSFKEQYRDAEEKAPDNIPCPRCRGVNITSFVNSSHASNQVTHRSHSGFIIFINRASIEWFSKRQNTVKTSSFSSEFIALKYVWKVLLWLSDTIQ